MSAPRSIPNSSSRLKQSNKVKSVSFSNEVSQADGNAVTIHEAQGMLDDSSGEVLLGRTIVGGVADDDDDDATNRTDSGSIVEGISVPNKHDETRDDRVVVVRLGFLKCGHRYRVFVPIPDRFVEVESAEGGRKHSLEDDAIGERSCRNGTEGPCSEEQERLHLDPPYHSSTGYGGKTEARIIQDSWDDDDLRGEVVMLDDGTRNVSIVVSARQRGPYRGKLLLEFVPCSRDHGKTNPENSEIASESLMSKAEMSILVEASIMGKGMGTPKLRSGVTCLGKLVGYDSDEETEWQGFG